MKKSFGSTTRKLVALVLALVMTLGMTGGAVAEENDKTVNIAVTGTIGSLNPLLMGATEVLKYEQRVGVCASAGGIHHHRG